MKLSVVLATYNEETNIERCLRSVKEIASEIVVVDGGSTDKTVELAQKYGARVIATDNPTNFHINKQKAIDAATGEWVMLLDADEEVSNELASEIQRVIQMNQAELNEYEAHLPNRNLFLRHQKLIEKRDHITEKSDEYVAFYFPRLNYFLGKFLRYGGVYPDGVIRLFQKGKAYLPAHDVHEQMVVEGKTGWLQHDLLHYDSPTFSRYLARNSRYIDLMVKQFQEEKLPKNIIQSINYFIIKPKMWFLSTTFRHKGILDGWQGVTFSLFSALRFPRAYWRYLRS